MQVLSVETKADRERRILAELLREFSIEQVQHLLQSIAQVKAAGYGEVSLIYNEKCKTPLISTTIRARLAQ